MATRHFRAHRRLPIKLPLTVSADLRPVAAKGHTCDLGLGGMSCELDTPLRLGEKVTIVLETQQGVQIQGKVAWVGWAESSAVRLGVSFDVKDEAHLPLILSLVEESQEFATPPNT